MPDPVFRLRLLPVSAGIFAGSLSANMVTITTTAICQALVYLSDDEQAAFLAAIGYVDLCLFDPTEAAPYITALVDFQRKIGIGV